LQPFVRASNQLIISKYFRAENWLQPVVAITRGDAFCRLRDVCFLLFHPEASSMTSLEKRTFIQFCLLHRKLNETELIKGPFLQG
jgi:hypothetical protein